MFNKQKGKHVNHNNVNFFRHAFKINIFIFFVNRFFFKTQKKFLYMKRRMSDAMHKENNKKGRNDK